MVNPVLEKVSYGLYSVNAQNGGRPTGCIINTLSQVTSENPLVSISMNKNNYTCSLLKIGETFSISILSEGTDPKVIGALGFHSGKDFDKSQHAHFETVSNVPVLKEDCCGHLILKLLSIYEAETHYICVARVLDEVVDDGKTPMTYDYYHKVIKGKAPKNAPTYRGDLPKETQTQAPEAEYVCTICGYVYKGELDDEPESYRCPICGVDKTQFKKRK